MPEYYVKDGQSYVTFSAEERQDAIQAQSLEHLMRSFTSSYNILNKRAPRLPVDMEDEQRVTFLEEVGHHIKKQLAIRLLCSSDYAEVLPTDTQNDIREIFKQSGLDPLDRNLTGILNGVEPQDVDLEWLYRVASLYIAVGQLVYHARGLHDAWKTHWKIAMVIYVLGDLGLIDPKQHTDTVPLPKDIRLYRRVDPSVTAIQLTPRNLTKVTQWLENHNASITMSMTPEGERVRMYDIHTDHELTTVFVGYYLVLDPSGHIAAYSPVEFTQFFKPDSQYFRINQQTP